MTVHIFRAGGQPATRHRVPGIRKSFTYPPRSLWWCRCCRRKRIAANVEVFAYYDTTNAQCVAGKGCRKAKRKGRGA